MIKSPFYNDIIANEKLTDEEKKSAHCHLQKGYGEGADKTEAYARNSSTAPSRTIASRAIVAHESILRELYQRLVLLSQYQKELGMLTKNALKISKVKQMEKGTLVVAKKFNHKYSSQQIVRDLCCNYLGTVGK